jgi:hypothetical protein
LLNREVGLAAIFLHEGASGVGLLPHQHIKRNAREDTMLRETAVMELHWALYVFLVGNATLPWLCKVFCAFREESQERKG